MDRDAIIMAQSRATGSDLVKLSFRFLPANMKPNLMDARLRIVEKPTNSSIRSSENDIELIASVTQGGTSSMEFYQIPDINPFWMVMEANDIPNSIFRVIIEK